MIRLVRLRAVSQSRPLARRFLATHTTPEGMEERLTKLIEGKFKSQAAALEANLAATSECLTKIDKKLDDRFDMLSDKIDTKFSALQDKFTAVDQQFEVLRGQIEKSRRAGYTAIAAAALLLSIQAYSVLQQAKEAHPALPSLGTDLCESESETDLHERYHRLLCDLLMAKVRE